MTNAEQIAFKTSYGKLLQASSRKVLLTSYEVQRKDFWSQKYFNSPDFAFMFPVLITNVQYAITNGYMVAND